MSHGSSSLLEASGKESNVTCQDELLRANEAHFCYCSAQPRVFPLGTHTVYLREVRNIFFFFLPGLIGCEQPNILGSPLLEKAVREAQCYPMSSEKAISQYHESPSSPLAFCLHLPVILSPVLLHHLNHAPKSLEREKLELLADTNAAKARAEVIGDQLSAARV